MGNNQQSNKNPKLYQDAAKAYKCAISINPMHGECHFNFGKLLISMNKKQEALALIRKANKLQNGAYKSQYDELKNTVDKEKNIKSTPPTKQKKSPNKKAKKKSTK